MSRDRKSVIRRQRAAGFLAIAIVLLACSTGTAVTATPPVTETPVLRLEKGAVELRSEDGGWSPVGGETIFEISGALEGTDPWMVNGNTFAVRESTRIADGLEAGARVRVKGVILDDRTWLASSIEPGPAGDQAPPAVIMIGKVASIAPWVVNGITLEVTSDTLIGEGIEPGMIVRVDILLLEDGTWEVLSIISLGEWTDIPGCATVSATVVSVEGNRVQLLGWPVITLGEGIKIETDEGSEAMLKPDHVILMVVCAPEPGQIVITHIIIVDGNEGSLPSGGNGEKVLICHKPDKKGGHTLSVSSSAVEAHLGHGDKLGACP